MFRLGLRRSLAILVSVALLATPLAASAGPDLHAKHAASGHAQHHPGADAAAPQTGKHCQQHESDGNSCCTACAHFAAAALAVSGNAMASGSRPIPFQSRLEGRLPTAPPGPPPRA